MKKIMSILVLVLFLFSAIPVLAEEADTTEAADETTVEEETPEVTEGEETPAEEPEATEEEVEEENTINPDSVLHQLDLFGERIRYIFTRKVNKAEYRLAKIREREAEMEEMSKKYANRVQQMEKFIEKARVNMEKHMQRIEGDLEEVGEEGNETIVRHGLEKSRERLLQLLERKPESKGLKRALQTHDINIEKIRLRLTRVNGEEEEDEEETEEEAEEETEEETEEPAEETSKGNGRNRAK